MRAPSLKLLETLPDIHCPRCELQMSLDGFKYNCPRCGYAFQVDTEKKLPVFPEKELVGKEVQRRYEIMKQFHSMRWSAKGR
ncbi:MAG: hypothetical protein PVJ27_06430 [Candidatus Brocadiaceae bacterium]|jgi:tRNA(Ile2) C34 agmatinyltransferase TiaS